ncbi:MAG: FAD-dependent oxidoreductase [Salinimicrobium sp.]
MKDFDVLIIGGGAAGMSCALVLGSGLKKSFAEGRKAGIILHQKSSHLQSALLNNVLGVKPGTSGKDILESGRKQLEKKYPELEQIKKEKVLEISFLEDGFRVLTNKDEYSASKVVIAVGYTNLFGIKGLEEYVIPHKKSKASKDRIQLKNEDHLVAPGLYVAGSLAGHRSQYAIACGSGAAVATDILTDWNKGEHTKVHDKI